MATSGSIETRIKEGSDLLGTNAWGKFDWTRSSYSSVNNTTTINWTISLKLQYGNYPAYAGESLRKVRVVVDGISTDYVASYTLAGIGKYTQILTGSTIIPHNADGTKTSSIAVYISERSFSESYSPDKVMANDDLSSHYNKPVSGSITLDSLVRQATIVTAPNFTDEDNPTITYNNPAGEAVTKLEACMSFTGAAFDVPYRDISKTGTSYTFELTDAERTTLRKGITSGNSSTIRIYIRSTVDGITYWDYQTKTITLVNYQPTLTPNIEDTNARTIELTGDSNKLIKYYSKASVTFGASAKKEATIIDRRVICGSKTIEIEDQAQDTVIVENVDSNTFYMRARDSRGYIVERAPVKALVNYVKLTNSMKSALLDGEGNLTFTISGKYFNGSFGAKKNSLEVEYLVLDGNGDPVFNTESGWTRLGTVTPTIETNNGYSYTYTIRGLNHEGTYILTVNAIDELTPVQSSTKVVAAVPVFDWGKDDFAHHTPVYFDNANGIYGTETINGMALQAIDPCNYNNNLVIGYGNYDLQPKQSNGIDWAGTNIYGNILRLFDRQGLYINNAELADFVVEHGTSGSWYYRKWNSGRVELYGYLSINNMACNVALGAMYRTAAVASPAYPFTVNNAKVITSYKSQGYGAFIWHTTAGTSSQPPSFYLIRPTSIDAISGIIDYHVQGTWK